MAEKIQKEGKAKTPPSPTKQKTPSPKCASPAVRGSPSPKATCVENKSPSQLSTRKTPQMRTPSPQQSPEPARTPSPGHTLVDRNINSPVKNTDNI